MAVLLVVAILSTIAIPSFADRIIMGQITDALTLSTIAKTAVSSAYLQTQVLPANNAAAGLPPSDHIVSNVVSDITVQNGVITITFGNQANPKVRGKILTLRPAVVPGYPQVPIAWLCANAPVPTNMSVSGTDKTNIPVSELPTGCRF